MTTMKAILMTQSGAPETLEYSNIAEPEIQHETHVKVRLKAAGVNPIDTKLRGRGLFYDNGLPAVLGCDGAGIVEETGAAVSRFMPGDFVWFCNGGLGGEQGNYAEFTVVDERWLGSMPEALDFVHAAAAPLVLITAWGALYDRARVKTGQTVLIHGGAGGVGHVAIQLAKLAGARVITTVSDDEKAQLARSLGADEIILYHRDDFVVATNSLTQGRGADVVFDTVGPDVFKRSIEATAHFGDLVTLLDPGVGLDFTEARMRNLRIGFELMLTPMLRGLHSARDHHVEILDQCGRWVDQGKLMVHISQTLPLTEAAHAHSLVETGHTIGKIVLEP